MRDGGLQPIPILKICIGENYGLNHTAIIYQLYFQNMLQIKGSCWLDTGYTFAVKGSNHIFNHPSTIFLSSHLCSTN